MPRNFGPESLARFGRTTPLWASKTERGRNPYSLKFRATPTTHYYNLSLAGSLPPIFPQQFRPFTISMWIKSPLTSDLGLFSFAGGTTDFNAYISTSGALNLGNGGTGFGQAAAVSANTWTHLAFSHDGVGNNATVWLNGVQILTGTIAINLTGATAMRIGYDGSRYFLDSFMDDIALFYGAATTAQISDLYGGGAPPRLDQITGNTLITNISAWWNQGDPGTSVNLFSGAFLNMSGPYWSGNIALSWTGSLPNAPEYSADRPVSILKDYANLAIAAGDWAAGAAIEGRYALASGSALGVDSPALLPFPRPGYGFVSASGSFPGYLVEPYATPVLTKAAPLIDETNTQYPDDLQTTTDARTVRRIRPNFVRKV